MIASVIVCEAFLLRSLGAGFDLLHQIADHQACQSEAEECGHVTDGAIDCTRTSAIGWFGRQGWSSGLEGPYRTNTPFDAAFA